MERGPHCSTQRKKLLIRFGCEEMIKNQQTPMCGNNYETHKHGMLLEFDRLTAARDEFLKINAHFEDSGYLGSGVPREFALVCFFPLRTSFRSALFGSTILNPKGGESSLNEETQKVSVSYPKSSEIAIIRHNRVPKLLQHYQTLWISLDIFPKKRPIRQRLRYIDSGLATRIHFHQHLGGVIVFCEFHSWMAECPTSQLSDSWVWYTAFWAFEHPSEYT